MALRLGICEGVSCYQELRSSTQSWVPREVFLVVCGFALQQVTATSALHRAGAVGISEVFGGAHESSKPSRCFTGVINQYFNPTEEPHKPGTKEKRKKAASFQTVSQLHKVRASPSPKALGEACSECPSASPACLPRHWGVCQRPSPVPVLLGKDRRLQAGRAMGPFELGLVLLLPTRRLCCSAAPSPLRERQLRLVVMFR